MKTTMIKLAFTLLLMVSIFACGGGGKTQEKSGTESSTTADTPNAKLAGKWEIVVAEGPMADSNKGTVYTFTETEMSTMYAKGKYTISGDTIINKFEGMETPFKYLFKFEGDKLKMEVVNSNGQKFTLEKR